MHKEQSIKQINTMNPSERVLKATEIIEEQIKMITEIIYINETNRYFSEYDVLVKQIPPSFAANAYNVISYSMVYFEILKICHLWDDVDLDSYSLPTVRALIDDDGVRKFCKTAAFPGRYSPPHVSIRASNDADREKATMWVLRDHRTRARKSNYYLYGRKWTSVVSQLKAAENDDDLTKMRNFRDKYLAHRLVQTRAEKRATAKIGNPRYATAARVLKDSMRLMNLIYNMVSGAGYSFESSRESAEHCHAELWNNCRFSIRDRQKVPDNDPF
jgi:hypothetical protein